MNNHGQIQRQIQIQYPEPLRTFNRPSYTSPRREYASFLSFLAVGRKKRLHFRCPKPNWDIWKESIEKPRSTWDIENLALRFSSCPPRKGENGGEVN
jgi:hypothetical protein